MQVGVVEDWLTHFFRYVFVEVQHLFDLAFDLAAHGGEDALLKPCFSPASRLRSIRMTVPCT
ncbi:MAG: hypothetical protein R3E93_12355 [Thiothrix sp.]